MSGDGRTLFQQERRLGRLMTLPAQLLLVFIVVFPLLMQVYLSFTYWGPTDGTSWLHAWESANPGDNYLDLLRDGGLRAAIGRTLLILVIAVPLEFLFGLGLAMLFVEHFPGHRLLHSLLLMPMMVVPAVAAYMFFMMFQSNGPVNQLLSALTGLAIHPTWLSDPLLAMAAVIVVDVWQWTPLMMLLLLAGMLSVPADQLLAAELLGASRWQRFIHITLPRMRSVVVIALALRSIEILKLFDIPFVMTRGGPAEATETLSHYIYKKTFNDLEWSYVAAVGLAVLVVLSLAAAACLRLAARSGRIGADTSIPMKATADAGSGRVVPLDGLAASGGSGGAG